MKRKFKSLGLVLAAVFAMSAIGASAASADEFHAESTGTITGEQSTTHVFTTNAGTWTCTKAHFAGTISSTTSTGMEVTPTYEGCKAFGFIGVPTHTTGCVYTYTFTFAIPPIDKDIKCGSGSLLRVTLPGCTTTIGSQSNLQSNTITNHGAGSGRHISLHTNVTGITYNECGTVRTNGTYKGTTTIFGKTAGGAANGIWYT